MVRIVSMENKAKWIIRISIVIFLYGLINASRIKVDYITIKIKNNTLKSPVRIAHLSDIHIGSAYRLSYIKSISDKVISLKPDLVVITGDLCDGNVKCEYEQIEPLGRLGVPTYFVAGNHDLFHFDEVVNLVSKVNITHLRNFATVYNSNLQLIGMDYNKDIELDKVLSNITLQSNMTNVLLYHAPFFNVKLLSKLNISLHLTGHTHGGQIILFRFLQCITFEYLSGLYSSIDQQSHVYVSEGIGTTGTPLRIGTQSTIALITLIHENAIY